jgi:hypothetical protein
MLLRFGKFTCLILIFLFCNMTLCITAYSQMSDDMKKHLENYTSINFKDCKNTYMKWPDKKLPAKNKSNECFLLRRELKDTRFSIVKSNKLKWLSSNYRAQKQMDRDRITEQVAVCEKELEWIEMLSNRCESLLLNYRLRPSFGTYDRSGDKILELEQRIEELESKTGYW